MSTRSVEGAAWWRQDDRIARAKDLWENHREISAEQIGKQLGCSKNAVIGIAKRQDFEPRGKSPSANRESTETHDAFEGLGPSDCRWPLGNPGMPGFHFCGAKAVEERPYCSIHCARAYVKPNGNGWTEERREKQTATGRRNFAALKAGRDAAD